MKEVPDDSKHVFAGISYKIGLRGKVFMWINGAWIASAKEPSDLDRDITKEDFKNEAGSRTY